MILPASSSGGLPPTPRKEVKAPSSAKKVAPVTKKIVPVAQTLTKKQELENKASTPIAERRVAKTATHLSGLRPLKIPTVASPLLSLSPPPSTPGSHSTFDQILNLKHIKDHAELFQSVARLKEVTKNAPMTANNIGVDNVNDVYIKEFKGEPGIRDVVFKPGVQVATKSALCYGIARIVGIEEAVLPAKKGQASVIGREQVQSLEDAIIAPGRIVTNNVTYIQLPNGFFIPQRPLVPFSLISNGLEGRAKISYLVPKSEILEVQSADKDEEEHVEVKGIKCSIKPTKKNKEYKLDTIYEEDVLPESITQKVFHKLSDEEDCEIIVSKNSYYEVDNDVITIDEKDYSLVSNADGTYDIQDLDEKLFLMVKGNDDKPYLVPAQEEFSIGKEANKGNGSREFVLKSGQKYYVEVEAKGIPQLVGHEVEGMVQVKVENAFTKAPIDEKALDVCESSKNREKFFERIDRVSFIKAFLAVILLRPQDGKLTVLNQSNIMFQAIPKNPDSAVNILLDPLHPVLIDYDDMLASDSELSTDPEITGGAGAEVHSIRNGLMALPQARDQLSVEERELIVHMIKRMVLKKNHIANYLAPHQKAAGGITDRQTHFLLNVIERMHTFITEHAEKDWTLEQLFFAVYPIYKKHWELLEGTRRSDPAYRAMFVGKESAETLAGKNF